MDEPTFRALVADQHKRLFRFVLKHVKNPTDAEDLTQQTFIEAWRSMQNYRGESSLTTWLFGIALNLVRNHLTRSAGRRYEFVSDEILQHRASEDETPSETAERRQRWTVLDRELAMLDPEMLSVLVTVGMEGLSYQEAAELLNIPIGTVRSRLSRVRTHLRERLAGTFFEANVTE